MEFNVNQKRKIVEIWLTREEKQNAALREKLKPIYQQFKLQKYLVAVFESGEGDLAGATSDLLSYNRRRIAQMEVEREGQPALGGITPILPPEEEKQLTKSLPVG